MGDLFGSMFKAFDAGGIGMYPISIALIFAIAIVIERIYTLYFRSSVDKEAFLKGLKKHVYAGDLDRAISYCAGQKRTPLVAVVKTGPGVSWPTCSGVQPKCLASSRCVRPKGESAASSSVAPSAANPDSRFTCSTRK